jgi:sporulation protein YlmC with PRC-barrel domain
MDVIRDVLDHQLVDSNQVKMGRVDSIVFELREGQPPRLTYIEVGMPSLARRLHPRLERWVAAVQSKWGAGHGESFRIPWSQVRDFNVGGIDIEVDLEAEATPVFAWEEWLRERVIGRIPGA